MGGKIIFIFMKIDTFRYEDAQAESRNSNKGTRGKGGTEGLATESCVAYRTRIMPHIVVELAGARCNMISYMICMCVCVW